MPVVSIIREDDVVVVDGDPQEIDCGDLPTYFHAIQWDGVKGHIEFSKDDKGRKLPNVAIVEFVPFQYLVERHHMKTEELRIKEKQEQEAREKAIAERDAERKRKQEETAMRLDDESAVQRRLNAVKEEVNE